MSPVVDDFGGSYRRARFKIVYAETFAASCNMAGFNAILPQRSDCALADFVIGNGGYKFGFVTVVCTGYRNVGFAAAVVNIKLVSLNKLFVVA